MEYNVNRFKNILLEENQKHNLVSRRTLATDIDKHIEDSLAILNYELLDKKDVVDIGSGAGFPSLILAILTANSHFTLLESDLKKSNFLKQLVSELSLANVTVIRDRAEQIGKDSIYRERFDICTSRAVAPINVILEYGLPLLKVGGEICLWKGRNYLKELEEAKNALAILGGELAAVHSYKLMNDEEKDRVLVVIKKLTHTPDKYPRRVGIPTKRPL